jgi:putative NADPH-quinone reductase
MSRRIAIIQGHPDPAGHHLLHAMADAYAEGAAKAGHEVRRIEVSKLEFSLLRTQAEI